MSARPRRAAATSAPGLLLAGAALLGGCAVGPDFVRPAAPAVDRYTREAQTSFSAAAADTDQRLSPTAVLPADWWRLFKSAPLDDAVQQALAHNPSLQAATASLRQSQDNLRAGNGVFYPHLEAGLAADRERSAPLEQGSTAAGSVFNLVTASATISYTLDIVGGERRAVEGLRAQVDNQRYLSKAAFVTLSANVVNTCIARAAYEAQIRATEQLIGLEAEQLRSIQVLVDSGSAPYANVLSQRSLIAANEALLAPLRQKVSQSEHLLALLEGVTPAEADLPDIALESLALPQDLPLSVPSQFVHQRPDILSAEALLHAANAEVGVATAALYPNLSLSANYGRAGTSLANLLGSGASRFWSVGPSLTAPLFEGGTLRAQRQSAIDAFDAQRASYRQTVLAAFAQVADALKALEHDAQTLQAQDAARRAASQALALLQANHRAGMVAYVDVLAADVALHEASLGVIQAQALRQQDTVALFVALGGGWWNAGASVPTGQAP